MARVTGLVFHRRGPGPIIDKLSDSMVLAPIRSQREGQLVIEDPVNRGHCQRDAVTQVQLRRAVQCTRTMAPSYVLRVAQRDYGLKIFVGGKFRDLSMSHENNENWHPTKITRYTVLT